MKSLLFAVPALLVLACGSAGTGDETPAEETVNQDTSSVTESPAEDAAVIETDADVPADITAEAPDSAEIAEANAILYTLKAGVAGVFTIGSSEHDALEASLVYSNGIIEEIEIMGEGVAYPALQMNFDTAGTVTLEISETDNTICRIDVNSDLFKTQEGIGIGSTYEDLQNNYSFNGIEWGDGGDPLVVVEDMGMSFLLEPGDWWQMGEVEGDIPGNTRITSVFLW